MGVIKKFEHFFEDLNPGRNTSKDDWQSTDPRKALEGVAGLLMLPEITFGAVAGETVKQLGGAVKDSLFGTVRKEVKRGNRFIKEGTRKTARSIRKAVKVPYTGKSQLNSARSGGNRRMADIPAEAKRVYESRYFEVYQDSQGKKYLWGKPTLGPKSISEDPAGFAREWGENLLRGATPKYKRSDPLEKDMARIKQRFGNMYQISGYSRGAAAARYQRADKNTRSRIYGSYAPYAGIGNHRNRRRRKFDPVHVAARGITKYTVAKRKSRYIL